VSENYIEEEDGCQECARKRTLKAIQASSFCIMHTEREEHEILTKSFIHCLYVTYNDDRYDNDNDRNKIPCLKTYRLYQ
jgi:hypothetical protein